MSKTHGLSNHPLYEVWHHMKQRCNGTTNKYSNERYHQRGIGYDAKWEYFINFYNDMNESFKQGLQLDRINNDLGYYKENCRWVTAKQNNNNRSNNIYYEIDGEIKTLNEWCEIFSVDYQTVVKRYSFYKIRDKRKLFSKESLSSLRQKRHFVTPCSECGREDGTLRPDGLPRRSKDGLCNTCYHRKLMRKIKNAAGYIGLAGDM